MCFHRLASDEKIAGLGFTSFVGFS